jgi:hypothetical protein
MAKIAIIARSLPNLFPIANQRAADQLPGFFLRQLPLVPHRWLQKIDLDDPQVRRTKPSWTATGGNIFFHIGFLSN